MSFQDAFDYVPNMLHGVYVEKLREGLKLCSELSSMFPLSNNMGTITRSIVIMENVVLIL